MKKSANSAKIIPTARRTVNERQKSGTSNLAECPQILRVMIAPNTVRVFGKRHDQNPVQAALNASLSFEPGGLGLPKAGNGNKIIGPTDLDSIALFVAGFLALNARDIGQKRVRQILPQAIQMHHTHNRQGRERSGKKHADNAAHFQPSK